MNRAQLGDTIWYSSRLYLPVVTPIAMNLLFL